MKLTFFLFIFPFLTFAQVKFDKTDFNLGEITESSIRYIDCKLENTGEKDHYILSVKTPREVTYIHQGSLIRSGENITLRVQANPKRKGKFSYEVLIYTSNKREPTKIKIKGVVKSLPKKLDNSFTNCPAFGNKSTQQIIAATNFELTVLVRDSATKEPLNRSHIVLLQKGKTLEDAKTEKSGTFTAEIPLGYTYFFAEQEGYESRELGTYVNFKRNYVIIDLPREKDIVIPNKPEELIVEDEELETTPEIIENPTEEIVEEEVVFEEENVEEEVIEITINENLALEEEATPSKNTELEENELVDNEVLDSLSFDEEHFMPNNIVFVIDVSSSMRSKEKLELMKYSLYQLTDLLRPIDKIALISYSSKVELLLNSTSGDKKESIKAMVESMEASGFTSGGEAIKLGFKEAEANYIANGNNQVIIITDGAFNQGSTDYKRYIRRYKRKGIYLSVVGIKNSESAKEEMMKASDLGNGIFVNISNFLDAKNNLVQSIRKLSYKR